MTTPSGNGETRGPESADGMGTPLPLGPALAKMNEAKAPKGFTTTPREQAGFGNEDMCTTIDYMGTDNRFASDCFGPPPDLAMLGDGGEAFGGM